MSVLLFGVSHRSAPVSVLEQVAISEYDRPKLIDDLLESQVVSEAMIVSTCNRVEVYAVVDAFHPALETVGQILGDHSAMTVNELTSHAYVRYSEAAVEHLFGVAAGLDSMVVGEQQILGQIRTAYTSAAENHSVGKVIHELAQQALRVGKRVHTETGIDRAGASVVSVSLHQARVIRGEDVPLRRAVVFGAGAMGGLAVSQLARDGVTDVVILNRTREKGENLAATAGERYGINARSAALDELADVMAAADVVVTCTGSIGAVVGVADVEEALRRRTDEAPLMFCDLGLPRDVDPAVGALPGVHLIDIEGLRGASETQAADADTLAAREIVADELSGYLAIQRQAGVTPTVAALRKRAADVVESEMLRLESRLPDLEDPQRDEIVKTVRRVVDKLLHAPTVRVKELASTPNGDQYAEALRELFELKPGAAQSVSVPRTGRDKAGKAD